MKAKELRDIMEVNERLAEFKKIVSKCDLGDLQLIYMYNIT